MTEQKPDPNAEIERAVDDLIVELATTIGAEAIHEFGPYAGVWAEMRRMARLPLHLRIDSPDWFTAQLIAAGPSGSNAVLARHAMITLLIDRQAFAGFGAQQWYQRLIDLAREIADRAMLKTMV